MFQTLLFTDLHKANLDSKNQFYCNKRGDIFNSSMEPIKGGVDAKSGVRSMTYTKTDGSKTKITFARLIYSTFYPHISLNGCNIVLLKKGIEFEYNLYNLDKISLSESPNRNNLKTAQEPYETNSKTFFSNFTEEQKEELITDLNTEKTPFLCSKYNVTKETITKAKNHFVVLEKEDKIIPLKFVPGVSPKFLLSQPKPTDSVFKDIPDTDSKDYSFPKYENNRIYRGNVDVKEKESRERSEVVNLSIKKIDPNYIKTLNDTSDPETLHTKPKTQVPFVGRGVPESLMGKVTISKPSDKVDFLEPIYNKKPTNEFKERIVEPVVKKEKKTLLHSGFVPKGRPLKTSVAGMCFTVDALISKLEVLVNEIELTSKGGDEQRLVKDHTLGQILNAKLNIKNYIKEFK